MEVPETDWHDVTLEDNIIENISYYIDNNKDKLESMASEFDGCFPGETPEFVASQIGFATYNKTSDKNICTPIDDDVDGREGRLMAFGYVGTHALAASEQDDG